MAAFKNGKGEIVIDYDEARMDIQNIISAKADLRMAWELLDPSRLDDSRMRGDMRDAYAELLERLRKDLDSWREKCLRTHGYIQQVVAP